MFLRGLLFPSFSLHHPHYLDFLYVVVALFFKEGEKKLREEERGKLG